MEVERRGGGKLFHARGPATANARSPVDARRVDGTTKSEVDAERSRRRAALATDTVRSDKYPGAAPFKQPCTLWAYLAACPYITYSYSILYVCLLIGRIKMLAWLLAVVAKFDVKF